MRAFHMMFAAVAVLASSVVPAVAAEGVAAGRIKGIDAADKEIVLTDNAGKEWTFKIADDLVVNRGGKEAKSDLAAGDQVNICYDKGIFARTARYVLVKEGDMKDAILVKGTVKQYDADKKQLTVTDVDSKDWTFDSQKCDVKVDGEKKSAADVKIGDKVVGIVDLARGAQTLKCVMIERK